MKTVPEILKQWEQDNGRCWVAEIQRIAEKGWSWADAAEFFEIPRYRLKAFCHRRGFEFPWQGHKSAVQRDHQRRMTLDNPSPGRPPKKYLYNGERYSIKELAALASLDETTIRCRFNRGWSVNESVETPYMDRQVRGRLGGLETRRRHGTTNKPFENYCAPNAAHGLRTPGDMGGPE
ncbi:hypothetical protein [Marinobacter phage PS6]|nr:hypothetical protein [Marinobacter phage PS6]